MEHGKEDKIKVGRLETSNIKGNPKSKAPSSRETPICKLQKGSTPNLIDFHELELPAKDAKQGRKNESTELGQTNGEEEKTRMERRIDRAIEIWNLELFWSLELWIWDLTQRFHVPALRRPETGRELNDLKI